MGFAHFLVQMFSHTRPIPRNGYSFPSDRTESVYAQTMHCGAFASFVRRIERGLDQIPTEKQCTRLREGVLYPSCFRVAVYRETRLSAISLAGKLFPIFFDMHRWLLTTAEGYCATTDHPVVLVVVPDARDAGCQSPTADVTVPLSPRASAHDAVRR